jgi:hypothetical protein
MIKTNQEFAFVLAQRASRNVGWSVFRRVATLEIIPGWVKAIVAEHPLILAGVDDKLEYCVTDSSVWRQGAEGEPVELFRLGAIAKTYWMRKELWPPSEGSLLLLRTKGAELKEQERDNVEVELDSGESMVLVAAGSWLMRFLERCSHYNAEGRK